MRSVAAFGVSMVLLLAACSSSKNGPGDSADASVQCADVAGTWNTTEVVDDSTCPSGGTHTMTRRYRVAQAGCLITVSVSGAQFQGSASSDRFQWTGSYPEGSGTTTITSMDMVLSRQGTAASGTARWQWSGAGEGCSGTTQITATKQPPPSVSETSPTSGEQNVPLDAQISVTFSASAVPITDASAFTLQAGATPVAGSVFIAGSSGSFRPSADLAPGTTYVATIRRGLEFEDGVLPEDFTWTFTTEAGGKVLDTTPANHAQDVSVATEISATFSKEMGFAMSSSDFTLSIGSAAVEGDAHGAGDTASFVPSDRLEYETTYTAVIHRGLRFSQNDALADDYVWTFTTQAHPAVTSVAPLDGAANVPLDAVITATFNNDLEPSLTDESMEGWLLLVGTESVNCRASWSGRTITWTPETPLAPSTTYTATVQRYVYFESGGNLDQDHSWTFTTAAQ